MLGKEYLTLDGKRLPNPVSFQMSSKPVERVNESESGSTLAQVVRSSKLTLACKSNCTSMWADEIERICAQPVVVVEFRGREFYARVRDFSSNLEENSAMVNGTDGLWTVSFKVLEI